MVMHRVQVSVMIPPRPDLVLDASQRHEACACRSQIDHSTMFKYDLGLHAVHRHWRGVR